MSVAAQALRSGVKSIAPVEVESLMKSETWAQHFPTSINTAQESCVFVKKLLTTALSSVTYLRGLLPEKCYANRKMDDIPIKVLRANADHPISKSLTACLQGTFEALEKKYLKEFFFIIYTDKDDPDGSVYEMYNFSFSYSDGVTSMHGTSNKEAKYENKIYNSTRLLLRTLCLLTQTFEPIPDEAYLTVKLTYHENTPDEYEPPGFSPSDLPPEIEMNHSVPGVSTHYHTLQVRLAPPRTRIENVHPFLIDGLTEEPNLHSKVVRQRPVLDDQEDVATGTGDAEPMSQGSTKELIQTKEVCFCGVDWQDGPMLQCYVCKKTSHGICYKILLMDQPIPEEGACWDCSSETYPCFYSKLPTSIQRSGFETILSRIHIRMTLFILLGRPETLIRGLDLEKLFTKETSEEILTFLADRKIIIPSDGGNGYYVEKNALYENYHKSLGSVNLGELIKLSEQSEFNKKINPKEDASMPMESMSLLAEENYEEPPAAPENSISEHTGRQGGRSLKRKKKDVNIENPRATSKSSESKKTKV